MFDSSDSFNLPFQEFEKSVFVLILSYLHDLHCDEPARVYVDSAINLIKVLEFSLQVWDSNAHRILHEKLVTCPNAPDPIPSIFAHRIIGLFGNELCIRVWGIVGAAVSALSELVRANLGFCARVFTSRCSTLFRVAGDL